MARSQIRRSGEQGSGLALAGLILGWIGVGFAVLVTLGIVLFTVAMTRSGQSVPALPQGG
jgi:Domain of unknown function (DUF4190)